MYTLRAPPRGSLLGVKIVNGKNELNDGLPLMWLLVTALGLRKDLCRIE